MLKTLSCILLISFSTLVNSANQNVLMTTSYGDIKITLYTEKAPVTVQNFLKYVESDLYTGTTFHRVIPGFMIQGGGYDIDYSERSTYEPIINEADNMELNQVGTIAMARTNQPHSATSQFFINVADNRFLNHTSKSLRGWGYAVFGIVIDGMDVVNRIASAKTGRGGPFAKDVPLEPIVIESIELIGN
tara:strand:- start:13 stop:579 length:567 start_codon:yes stop_codon:yes gene_type:complete